MSVTFSFSVKNGDKELVQKIMAFKETGNLSALVNKLLRAYFDGKIEDVFETKAETKTESGGGEIGNQSQSFQDLHSEIAEVRKGIEELVSRVEGLVSRIENLELRVDGLERKRLEELVAGEMHAQAAAGANSVQASQGEDRGGETEYKTGQDEGAESVEEEEKEKKEKEAVKLINPHQTKESEEELIKDLREIVFDDLSRKGVERFINWCENKGWEPDYIVKARLENFADDKKISIERARELFLKAFPECEELV
ncbi:hypothetical protein [Ferroglobus placidus]|uniref:hypothetical protein n=1 Tax=Ferroglobus placidus TaxID=54261 RepID=UPI0011D0E2C7|nr:hypothetical protein [Ferroglobus placidus]